jgi:hypothetical protein
MGLARRTDGQATLSFLPTVIYNVIKRSWSDLKYIVAMFDVDDDDGFSSEPRTLFTYQN